MHAWEYIHMTAYAFIFFIHRRVHALLFVIVLIFLSVLIVVFLPVTIDGTASAILTTQVYSRRLRRSTMLGCSVCSALMSAEIVTVAKVALPTCKEWMITQWTITDKDLLVRIVGSLGWASLVTRVGRCWRWRRCRRDAEGEVTTVCHPVGQLLDLVLGSLVGHELPGDLVELDEQAGSAAWVVGQLVVVSEELLHLAVVMLGEAEAEDQQLLTVVGGHDAGSSRV